MDVQEAGNTFQMSDKKDCEEHSPSRKFANCQRQLQRHIHYAEKSKLFRLEADMG